MAEPIIIPQPQQVTWLQTAPLPLPRLIALRPDASVVEQRAAQRLSAALPQTKTATAHEENQSSFRLLIDAQLAHPEGYRIYDDGQDVYLVGADALGISHAVETARQLLRADEWPRCAIEDWPDYTHRGIYVESFWGTDLMELADWQQFIDYLVSLKLNTLNVGLHGCWEIKYNNTPTEFLLVPLRRYPQLQTPQLIRYIDPVTNTWVEKSYLPRSFENDFLPEVFAYAQAHGLRIVPQFGGPGHNTLIPRLLPELSAKKVDGTPTYYGYCGSSTATWEFLRNVVDELVERYCRPFGVTHFNVAGDEVYPLRSVLPDAPQLEASPWCACPECRPLSHFAQLSRYLLGMTELLAQHGIRAVIWADTIDRLDAMADFKQVVAQRGLTEQVVLQWWCYKEPLPTLTSAPELETWVEPSPGLVGNLLYQDFSRNIYGFLQRGRASGATGVTAYNVPDQRLDKNYACLAEFSWNSGAGSIPHFHIRYAQQTYGAAWRTALEAYDVAERIMGCYPMAVYVMDQLLNYFNTFPPGRSAYPLDLLRTLVADPLAVLTGIRIVNSHMSSAETLLDQVETNPGARDHFRLECRRYRVLGEAVLAIVESLRFCTLAQAQVVAAPSAVQTTLQQAQQLIEHAHAELRAVMLDMVRLQAAYLLPSALRELSPLLDFLGQFHVQLEQALTVATPLPAGLATVLPMLEYFDLGKLRAVWHPWEF